MSALITRRTVKLLCGRIAFESGEAYVRAGKVIFTRYDAAARLYEAEVQGSGKGRYEVTVRLSSAGDVDARCACPSLASYDKYCNHIAAVLLQVSRDQQAAGAKASAARLAARSAAAPEDSADPDGPGESRLADGVLSLFEDKPALPSGPRLLFDARTPLIVEIECRAFRYADGKALFAIELKLGPKRTFAVPRIRDFLARVDRGTSYPFTKLFAYDPEQHRFGPEDDAVIRRLIRISRDEALYRETASLYPAGGPSGDRLLPVPPAAWPELLALLERAPGARIVQGDRVYERVASSNERMPLRFAFGRDDSQREPHMPGREGHEAGDGGYLLQAEGLDEVVVMEGYETVLAGGMLYKPGAASCGRLAELKRMLDDARGAPVRIPASRMEAFMARVVPGLMKLGSVHIADTVSDRLVQAPLKASLYLDRVRDRLLAGLEFQYGDIVLNPLEGPDPDRGDRRILVRDGERERRILQLMEESAFAKTEAGYVMGGDEDGEFEFLYQVVPQLEKLLTVYATSAVKPRLFVGSAPAKVKVDVDERTDWMEFKFNLSGIPEAEIRSLLKSLEEKRRYHRLQNGAFVPLERADFAEIGRLLDGMGVRSSDLKGTTLRLPAVRGLILMNADESGSSVKLGRSLRLLLANMRHPDQLDFPVPERLASVLRDYQAYGYQWLKTLAHYRFGGILADDMGLGKTVQSIAFLLSALPELRERGQPALVVCPASLMYNWRSELAKFAPELRAVIADGSRAEREATLRDISRTDVVITSYPLLRRDIVRYAAQPFHTLVLDEAQAFKNQATQTAQAVKRIQATHRFALTGTPVENALEELHSIFGAVFPELLPSRRAFGEMSREAVAERIRPFVLRRVKTDVLRELPDKIETLQSSDLLPEQKKLYAAYLAKLKAEALKHLDKETFHKNRIRILAGLTRLRQLCCHPALFVEDYAGGSAKFEQLLEILEECRSAGKRALVFSQFTEMLGLIRRELGARGFTHFYLDGQTPAAERLELCDRFNGGERDLFLASLKAGGTGLNLTGADTVILYDLWWNPAVEQQAADRVHRIGQMNVVQIIRLVAQGTVEDKMYELQQRKKHLIDEVIQPGQEALSALTEQEIRELLSIG
ncbi:DEAD/DEAH box helicase [Cohnella nanjingensis]|uniref:SNF2 helicase associated domain-containing protein n=1 Tax=Cohnella nanjingensis TaxID=1387779 RepID=A0A7X0VH90_9BACL|nr:DEAD/DEAH box helicase [Cohnella nanjingensis]MBB6673646.1 SNF2 helicase associated domain-containing protein [Cohnella nanjingensis]